MSKHPELASEFIVRLQEAIDEHGDLPFRIDNEYWMSQERLSSIKIDDAYDIREDEGEYEGKVLTVRT